MKRKYNMGGGRVPPTDCITASFAAAKNRLPSMHHLNLLFLFLYFTLITSNKTIAYSHRLVILPDASYLAQCVEISASATFTLIAITKMTDSSTN